MDRSFLEENGVDVNAGLELLGDMDMYNETMGDFLEEINEKLPKLIEYKNNNDMPNYAIIVHSIKSDSKYLKRYPFSGLIICGECGSKFKRQTQSSGVAWACKTHLFHKEQCSIKFIKEEAIKAALTTMMNKLIFGYKRVLKPYLESIKLVKTDDNLQRILNLKENIQKKTKN